MATLLRPSSRQLSQLAATAARSVSRPSLRAFQVPRFPPATCVHRVAPRFYSTNPSRPPKKDDAERRQRKKGEESGAQPEDSPTKPESDGGAHDGETAGFEAPRVTRKKEPLPDGWAYLEDKQIEAIRSVLGRGPPSLQKDVEELVAGLQVYGAPIELHDLLKKKEAGGLSLTDGMKVLRIVNKIANRHAQVMQEKGDDIFTSQAPKIPKDTKQRQDEAGAESSTDETGGDKKDTPRQDRPGKQERRTGQEEEQPNTTREFTRNDIVSWVVIGMVFYAVQALLFPGEGSREITWQELRKNFLDKGLVEKLVVVKDRVRVELNREATKSVYPDSVAANPGFHYYFTIGSVDAFESRAEQAQEELGIPPSERIPISYATTGWLGDMLMAFGPTILLIGLLYWVNRRALGGGGGGPGGVFGFGKSKAKRFSHESAVRVKFADVAGMDEAKVEIMEFVSFLKSPEKFERLGAKIPRGAILSGPPGTGKTLLAKATAGESGVPFFSVSGSEFVEMFVGVGASRVRDLFANARKNAPCIVFIDEIDAIGKSRVDGRNFGGGNDEREATLNQILTEMDGFNTSEQVVVLAGTNRPDILDKALMRPGRFDRHINIDSPTMKGRKDIFKVYLAKITTKEDMEHLMGRLAALTPGFSGADIANVVNEAALIAARANADSVTMMHFEQAIERVVGGLERKSLVLKPEERKTVAYHEAGHAICGWYLEWADPLLKVSIIPRGQGALGYAQYLPGDAYLMTERQLMDRMAMTLGGRVSEELHFPTVTTGASDDFKKVTAVARAMVTEWGMSDRVGPLSFRRESNDPQKPFAESTAQTIDAEVRRIVDSAYATCRDLLTARKKEVGLIAEELLKKEVLTRDDMVRLLGPRQWQHDQEFARFFNNDAGKSAPPPPGEITPDPPEAPASPAPAAFKELERM